MNATARQRDEADAVVARLSAGPAVRAAIGHLLAGRVADAEAIVRRHLQGQPGDATALALLGDIAARAGVHGEAERLFRSALAQFPRFTDAQFNLAKILALRDGVPEAIRLLEDIFDDRPERTDVAAMRLALLGQLGDYDRAEQDFVALLGRVPDRPDLWTAFGNLQATRGDLLSSIAAFQRALALDVDHGAAWWGLANLKTYRFGDREIGLLEDRLARRDDALLAFALGKALQDRDEAERSFARYAQANRLIRNAIPYDRSVIAAEVDRSTAFFSTELFERAAGGGCEAFDPIFIVGLPRSGSTLLEQILASHDLIEGTSELPYIPMLVHRVLAERWGDRSLVFPDVLAKLDEPALRTLGEAYLGAARAHRRTARPYFIDKLPNNWRYVGFIKLILPNAKIIDARREPMACLWSNYCQWFARGQEFSYDLSDLADYRRFYVRLMSHFDAVIPGAVRRVEHEELVEEPEQVIRRLIADLALPFDPACLRFHENQRPVRTASAQQVRRPIDRTSNDAWRKFERWLEPLREELGIES